MKNMLRKIRIVAAVLFFTLVTLLFLDFTGTLHAWFGWMARVQLLPAVLALNIGVVALLVVLTLLFGRIYCSVICPLGVMQDVVSRAAGRRKKYRFKYSPARTWLRYGVLALFVALLAADIGWLAALIAPYSAYGRIVSNLLSPLYQGGNNLLAYAAEWAGSYAFYSVDVWMKSVGTLLVAVVTFAVLFILAWRNGRTYCNTVCPVGTVLGVLSRYSLFKPRFDVSKCNGCKLCSRNCKASCIDPTAHRIDYSRCVACMDCLETCRRGAIGYTWRQKQATPAAAPQQTVSRPAAAPSAAAPSTAAPLVATPSTAALPVAVPTVVSMSGSISVSANAQASALAPAPADAPVSAADPSRRRFLSVLGLFAFAVTVRAQEKKVDGGLALIEEKKIPDRATPLTPPGSLGARNMAAHCTACQLCVSVCPNQVLRPSGRLMTLMQPEMSYERGYCRPECTKCSEVCPAGAIRPITSAEKSATQIGHAVWIRENCVVGRDGVQCNNCSRHCPAGAIAMVDADPNDSASLQIPVVNEERCIGCGACENLCPARPFSAIYVEGHVRHRTV